jgi:hypothetical protein
MAKSNFPAGIAAILFSHIVLFIPAPTRFSFAAQTMELCAIFSEIF